MMIQDEELRSLYHVTGTERLQKLQMGLLQLEQEPDNQAVLEELRRQIHSLKGDSKIVGLGTIAELTQQIEDIVKALQADDVKFTIAVNDYLYQGLQATEQLLHEAVTGEPGDVDIDAIHRLLGGVFTDEGSPSAAPTTESTHASHYIEDDELREIYRSTSEGRLDALEASLNQLTTGTTDVVVLETLRRETHSLKGDSRAVGLDTVADLVQSIEDAVRAIEQEPTLLTSPVSDGIDYGFTVIRHLVHEAVSGEQSGIDIGPVQEYLTEIVTSLTVAAAPTNPAVEAVAQGNGSEAIPSTVTATAVSTSHQADATRSSFIEDAELREIYCTTSAERLQRLEANLLYLEKDSQDEATLSALLRETHSLKGDSRSTGVDAVEAIAHAVEDVVVGVQQRTIALDAAVSDILYQSLDAMRQLVQAAATGAAAEVTVSQTIAVLQDVIPAMAPEDSASLLSPGERSRDGSPEKRSLEAVVQPTVRDEEPAQIDSVRVQSRELDALLSQAEELAVTRIQIAQTSTQAQQLIALWEEWQTDQQSLDASTPSYEERMEALLLTLRATVQENSSKLDIVAEEIRDRVRKLQLLPLSILFQPLPRLVRDLAKQQSKDVDLILEGGDITVDKRLLEGIKDSLIHLVRNAVDHGIEAPEERAASNKPAVATLRVKAHQTAISLTLDITDDGKGLDIERIKRTAIKRGLRTAAELENMSISQIQRLILAPGFSTRTFITEISGRGVGLDVLRTQVERLKGGIQIDSTPGQGCTFRLQLSTALSTANVVLVETQGITLALPIEFLQMSLLVAPGQVKRVEGRDTLMLEEESIPVAELIEVLELHRSPLYSQIAQLKPTGDRRPCVLLKIGEERAGFFVDRLITQQEVVSKPLGPLLKRVRNVSGATILGTGEVCLILNPSDLVKSLYQKTVPGSTARTKQALRQKSTILLVEDSPPVRIQEKRLFEGAGYDVVTAIHGLEGYNKLRTHEFDAVVSDVEMPYIDGFSLVAKIRQHPEYEDLPVVLVTTLDSDEDRKRGADAGASAYIIKGQFNQDVLLETLERLL